MRAAAILGPGDVSNTFAKFQRVTDIQWTSLIEQADAVVIFGGDGTVHHQLETLIELDVPLLVVPCGSGNDFARALGIRKLSDSARAWRQFATGTSGAREVDLGVIRSLAGEAPIRFPSDGRSLKAGSALRYFCCVAGVGLDSHINKRANELPRSIRAHGGYALTAARELLRFAPFPMKVSNNGNSIVPFRPTMFAAVANAPAYGGGMKIAPRAKLDDGKLDLVHVRGMDAFKLFCLFPTVFFGRHLGFEEVEYQQTDAIRIETHYPFDVYADGEFVCQTPVEFSIVSKALKVIVPSEQ